MWRFETVKKAAMGAFLAGYFIFFGGGFHVSAQSMERLSERIELIKAMETVNAGKIGILEDRINRNSDDINKLAIVVADVSKMMNRFTGIGIAIGAIGAVIVVMQIVGLKKG